tara:strand:+ start:3058 stop:3318 length:261 start_codon:yes stop_codon:yes gene_type:complete
MDKFNLKKYLAEGKLNEGKDLSKYIRNKKTTIDVASLLEDIYTDLIGNNPFTREEVVEFLKTFTEKTISEIHNKSVDNLNRLNSKK